MRNDFYQLNEKGDRRSWSKIGQYGAEESSPNNREDIQSSSLKICGGTQPLYRNTTRDEQTFPLNKSIEKIPIRRWTTKNLPPPLYSAVEKDMPPEYISYDRIPFQKNKNVN